MTFDKSQILIILPAFNEAEVIAEVLDDIQKEGYQNICLIDDGSTDQTSEVAQNYPIHILTHIINRGAGAAIQTGIQFARNEEFKYVVLIDSDGQHLPGDIHKLYTRMQETDADIVIGNRFFDTDNSIPKRRVAYNRIANVFTNIFCKKDYKDTQSGFRLLNRKAIETIQLQNKGFGFCSEMIIQGEKQSLKIDEVPIRVLYTTYSMAKGQNLRVGVRTARSILWQVLFG